MMKSLVRQAVERVVQGGQTVNRVPKIRSPKFSLSFLSFVSSVPLW
jgi:hypothetical protein